MDLNEIANPVDFNGGPVIVDKNCRDRSACTCKSGFSVELIIKFVSVRVPSQEVELSNGLGEVPGQVCHGGVEFVRCNPPMCVDRKGDPVSEVGPTWEAFWSLRPTMVAPSVDGRSRLNDQEITIGNVEWSHRAWPVVVTANGVVTVTSDDAGVMWDLLGDCCNSNPDFGLEFLENNQRIIGMIAEPHSEERSWCNLWESEWALEHGVGASTKVGGKLLLEVRSRDNGVKLDGKHARWSFPKEGDQLLGSIGGGVPMSVELKKTQQSLEGLRSRLNRR